MPRPAAGQLKKRIVIQAKTQTRDSTGGMVETWQTIGEPRAKIDNISGKEGDVIGDGGSSGSDHTYFTIRFLPGIDTTMRVVYGGRNYNITYVNDYSEEHRWLVLTAHTGLNNG